MTFDKKNLHALFIRIGMEHYHYVKFILEGYDGLAIMSRIDENIVVIRYPYELHKDLIFLLSSLAKKIRYFSSLL